ncbi:hypothetical protein FD724_31445 [Nostoc sp. C057]|uniref:DUF4114 domain-containing protein n=1 Tax=Nostoc sp. C057 TaxID=2576903 RepID=UPI0015C31D2D|nr:DUF4114 domain-containing protein [Nostoc sp. C057]QLE52122.1 hypothetical protein FD724_31445 [Nostoc sp. C057]
MIAFQPHLTCGMGLFYLRVITYTGLRLLGNNTFGFEDLLNGGDKDYNGMIVQLNLSDITV